jgi:hypothetical protein
MRTTALNARITVRATPEFKSFMPKVLKRLGAKEF